MKIEAAIKAIKKRVEELNDVHIPSQYDTWKKRTAATLLNVYKPDDVRFIGLSSIRATIPNQFYSGGLNVIGDAISESREYLNSLIEDLENFGIPSEEKEQAKGVNVNVNQHNSQNQSTNVNINLELFIEAIKDELKGGQVKELKAILEGDEEPEQKKKSFVDKIKSFGSDVASNILANVLTNPQVYEQLGGMF